MGVRTNRLDAIRSRHGQVGLWSIAVTLSSMQHNLGTAKDTGKDTVHYARMTSLTCDGRGQGVALYIALYIVL